MSTAKIVKIPTDKSPVLQLYLSYSQDIARASALRATIPRIDYGHNAPFIEPYSEKISYPMRNGHFLSL